MSGGVRYDPGISKGYKPVLTFDDHGSGNLQYMGTNWILSMIAQSTPGTGVDLDGAIAADGAGGYNYVSTGLFGGMIADAYPAVVDNAAILPLSVTKGLYSEFKITARTVSGTQFAGVGVSVAMSRLGAKYIMFDSPDQNLTPVLARYSNAGPPDTVLDGALFNYVVGDTLRLEYRVVGGNAQLKTYKNGVLQKTTVDSSAGKIVTGGLFGASFIGVQVAARMAWSNYRGGVLP